ncbi:MAG: TIGR02449 family protein [Gammaproteobacteria bacterium]|nr:TIGR02449 family protein [Gammaproteobacteria bacterium]
MEKTDIKRVEHGIDELIRLCQRMNDENRQLREEVRFLQQENNRLLQVQRISRSKMEGIITRLKTMEHEI